MDLSLNEISGSGFLSNPGFFSERKVYLRVIVLVYVIWDRHLAIPKRRNFFRFEFSKTQSFLSVDRD